MKDFYGRENGANKNAYYLAVPLTGILLRIFMKRLIIENSHYPKEIPKNASIFVAPNHESHPDLILVSYSLLIARRGTFLNFMSKLENFENQFLGFSAEQLGAYSLDRSKTIDKQNFRHTKKLLDKGQNLLMFIEGTRTKDGNFGEPFPGLVKYATNAQKNNPQIPYFFQPVAITYKDHTEFIHDYFYTSRGRATHDKKSALEWLRMIYSFVNSIEASVTFCKPIDVSSVINLSASEITDRLLDSSKQNIKVYNDRIVSHALLECGNDADYEKVCKVSENLRIKLYRAGANLENHVRRESAGYGWILNELNSFEEKGIISLSDGKLFITPDTKHILEYKVNRIKHLVK